MKFPEIPTDNLYKFMAISGIVIVIGSCVCWYYLFKFQLKNIHLGGEITEFKAIDKQQSTMLENISKEIISLEKRLSSRYLNLPHEKEEAERIREKLSALEKKREENIVLSNKHIITAIRILTKHKEQEYLNDVLEWVFWWSVFTGSNGIIISGLGFGLWYIKLQIPQDRIIKRKAKDEQK